MKGRLFIHGDRASPNGGRDLPSITYTGARPAKVICVTTREETRYFTDERDAHRLMQAGPVRKLRILPVLD